MKTYAFPRSYAVALNEDKTEEAYRIMFLRNRWMFVSFEDDDDDISCVYLSEFDQKRLLKEQTWEIIEDETLGFALDECIKHTEEEKELD